MKAKSIKVSFGRTINTGNFENVRLDAEIEFDLEGENLEEAYNEALKIVAGQVNQKAKMIQNKIQK